MPSTKRRSERRDNPLKVVERVARANEWPFESDLKDEIALIVTGRATNYRLSFSWMNDIEVLHLACGFEMKVPPLRQPEVQRLLAGINEQLWIGHFDFWTESSVVMFRHSLLLVDGISVSERQCEALLGSALDTCERHYPAFQFVIWAGKSARESMDAVMFETAGAA